MKSVQVSRGSVRLNALLLAVFGQSVVTAMTNNSNFLNPYPVLGLLQTALGILNAAIAAQHPGNKLSTEAVKAAKMEVNRILKALAAYVEFESNTDVLKAMSSGFNLVQGANHSGGNIFSATQGVLSGTVDLSSPAIGGAYAWEFTLDPIIAANWQSATTTILASYTITGLTPGLKYWFRVAAITNEGQQPFCDPIMVHVI
jgi:hypothetical protein